MMQLYNSITVLLAHFPSNVLTVQNAYIDIVNFQIPDEVTDPIFFWKKPEASPQYNRRLEASEDQTEPALEKSSQDIVFERL